MGDDFDDELLEDVSEKFGIPLSKLMKWKKERKERRKNQQHGHKKGRYSEDTKDNLVKDYLNGTPPRKLVEKYDVSTTTIYNWLDKRGVNGRSYKVSEYSEEYKKQIVAEYVNGKSPVKLSKEYDISINSLYRWIHEFDTPLKKKEYSDEFKNRLINEYLEGTNGPEIYEKYGVQPPILYYWLDKKGIKKRHRKHTSKEFKKKVLKEYDEGITGPELAKKYGISPSSVYRWKKKYKKTGTKE